MYKNERSFFSRHLNREMFFREYGNAGKPLVVFPSSGGSFYEYEDFGMIDALRPFIEEGKIRVFTPDSMDQETWLNDMIHPFEKAARHNLYDLYITEELCPMIYHECGWEGKFAVTGCSLGAYHALNFFLRHPDIFDTVIALSGIYDIRYFTGTEMNFDVYINSPTDYLKNLEDPWYLEKYQESQIILCSGQGSWEDDTIRDTKKIAELFREKNIPAWIDFWGHDVNHDWDWWRIQIAYFFNKILK